MASGHQREAGKTNSQKDQDGTDTYMHAPLELEELELAELPVLSDAEIARRVAELAEFLERTQV